jgi:UDP-hydrolysing UDP-N-acetyl-D-glucosamine 2-epimerase
MAGARVVRKVCVVVGSRANYSSIKSAMAAIRDDPSLRLQLVVGASALLDRYGTVLELIEGDGFVPDEKVFMLIEGETPSTMAKSTGLGLLELPTAFERLEPDIVITVGDRFETMATALAATYMNIPLAHTMGGELSGNIDESIRHAVTKFAHIHFPACSDAAERIIRMGENPEAVHVVGCPRMDLVAEALADSRNGLSDIFASGVGGTFDLDQPFLIVSQHPVTTEYGEGEREITETLRAVQELDLPAIVLWPNADAGAEHIARGIRKLREHEDDSKLHFFKNLPTTDYVKLMARTACLVGNSSSAIREGSFIGTPAVNIGTRQKGRQRGSNVLDVGYDKREIAAAMRGQIDHGRYESEPIYGDGRAGGRIAEILRECSLSIVKRMTY